VVLVNNESTVLLNSRMILGSAGIKDVLTVEDSRKLIPLLVGQKTALSADAGGLSPKSSVH